MFPIHGRDQNKNTFLHVNVQILKRDFFFSSFRNKTFRNRLMNPPPPSPKKLLCIVSDNAANLSEVLWIRVVLQSGGRPGGPQSCRMCLCISAAGDERLGLSCLTVCSSCLWSVLTADCCFTDYLWCRHSVGSLLYTTSLWECVFLSGWFSANIKSLFEGQRPAH